MSCFPEVLPLPEKVLSNGREGALDAAAVALSL